MDRFGRDVVAMKEDERHFRVTVSVAVSNQFYGWVFGLGKAVRIIGPESVKEGMKKALADIAARSEARLSVSSIAEKSAAFVIKGRVEFFFISLSIPL